MSTIQNKLHSNLRSKRLASTSIVCNKNSSENCEAFHDKWIVHAAVKTSIILCTIATVQTTPTKLNHKGSFSLYQTFDRIRYTVMASLYNSA